jgi:murein DD-endopeptidase MepM/ murein hydrolase activator NlpD
MKKIISLSFFLIFLQVFATPASNKSFAQVVALKSVTDTVPFVLDEEEMSDFNDSMALFPAYDLYCGWDTVNIHSPKFNVSCFKDSSHTICLYEEFNCGYYHPFAGRVTSDFGPRRKRYHYGVDIDLETGDKVSTAFDGKVRIAKKSKTYGNVVVVRHANGLETYYAHLSKINVEVGQELFAGDVIGLGGNTGRSRGSHLHFEVRYKGQPINPNQLISFNQQKLIADTLLLSNKTFDYVALAKKVAVKNYSSKKGTPAKNNTASKNNVSAKGGGKVHTVVKGDTLYAIAKRYGTTVDAICKKNGLNSKSTLKLGQKIKV